MNTDTTQTLVNEAPICSDVATQALSDEQLHDVTGGFFPILATIAAAVVIGGGGALAFGHHRTPLVNM